MLSPGPDMILVMRNTLTGDRRHGSLTALGVLTGNLVHIAYCTLGIALLLSRSPLAYNVLRIASAVYLVYLGIQSLRRGDTTKAEPTASAGTRSERTAKASSTTCSTRRASSSSSACSVS